MKRKIVLAGIVLFTIVLFLQVSSAIMEKPEWERGDYWKYRYKVIDYDDDTVRNIREDVIREEVIGKKNISIDNNSYNVLIIKIIPLNASEGEEPWMIKYYNSSDFSLIEVIRPFNSTFNFTFLYKPVLKEFNYPLSVGKEWEAKGKVIIHDPYNKWKQNFSYRYVCTGKKKIIVPAGKFSCYVIKKDTGTDGDTYTLYYVSSEVGNEVKELVYIDGKLISEKILISFHYGRNSGNKQLIPNFGLLLFLGGMVISILIKKHLYQ